MTSRHAAALALLGWYLMVPPAIPGGPADPSLPISQWDQRGAFDSIRDCEDARSAQIARARTDSSRIRHNLQAQEKLAQSPSMPAQQAAELNQVARLNRQLEDPELDRLSGSLADLRASRCVESGDPRLQRY